MTTFSLSPAAPLVNAVVAEPPTEQAEGFSTSRSVSSAVREKYFEAGAEQLEKLLQEEVEVITGFALLKALRFWATRKKRSLKHSVGERRAQYLAQEWKHFLHCDEKYYHLTSGWRNAFKLAVFEMKIENYLLEFQTHSFPQNLPALVQVCRCFACLTTLSPDAFSKAAEGLNYARRLVLRQQLRYANKTYFINHEAELLQLDCLLIKLYWQEKKQEHFLQLLGEALFWNPFPFELSLSPVCEAEATTAAPAWQAYPLFAGAKRKLQERSLSSEEVAAWLPVQLQAQGFFTPFKPLSEKEYQLRLEKLYRLQVAYYKNREGELFERAKLCYAYLYLLKELFLKYKKLSEVMPLDATAEGFRKTLQQEIKTMLRKISQLAPSFYQQLKKEIKKWL